MSRDRQIGFRVSSRVHACFEAAAMRDGLKIAAFTRRLAEWALAHCEQVYSIFFLEQSRVVPPTISGSRAKKRPAIAAHTRGNNSSPTSLTLTPR